MNEPAASSTSWTAWQTLDQASAHARAAVYEVRLVVGARSPASIPRFLDVDDEGLLCLGQTNNMERRRRQFVRGVAGRFGHSSGNLLYLLREHTPLNRCFPNHRLEYRYRPEVDVAAAKAAEAAMIKTYVGRFGEVPPLNSAIPDRYVGWPPSDGAVRPEVPTRHSQVQEEGVAEGQ